MSSTAIQRYLEILREEPFLWVLVFMFFIATSAFLYLALTSIS